MIQATFDRLRGLADPDHVLVVTNEALVEGVAKQLPELTGRAVLGEPCKRDTAACVGLAAGIIARTDPQGTMLVLPADHVISPVERFQAAVQQAVKLVQEDPSLIVTFGVPPTYPAESYGYIERGDAVANDGTFKVKMFREKPNAATAKQYLESGKFYWNSGIFVWKAKTIWDALREFEPEMVVQLDKIVAAYGSADFPRVFRDQFEKIRGKSIDYAVMERYPNVAVIEVSFDWDDVGSWQSLTRLLGADENGNTVIGRHLGVNTRGCIVRTDDQHLVVTLGIDECIVVHTPDATLVARKQDEESVRKVVEILKERDWTEFL
jgi:mannose-1-phosphate guanylyltransferase